MRFWEIVEKYQVEKRMGLKSAVVVVVGDFPDIFRKYQEGTESGDLGDNVERELSKVESKLKEAKVADSGEINGLKEAIEPEIGRRVKNARKVLGIYLEPYEKELALHPDKRAGLERIVMESLAECRREDPGFYEPVMDATGLTRKEVDVLLGKKTP